MIKTEEEEMPCIVFDWTCVVLKTIKYQKLALNALYSSLLSNPHKSHWYECGWYIIVEAELESQDDLTYSLFKQSFIQIKLLYGCFIQRNIQLLWKLAFSVRFWTWGLKKTCYIPQSKMLMSITAISFWYRNSGILSDRKKMTALGVSMPTVSDGRG